MGYEVINNDEETLIRATDMEIRVFTSLVNDDVPYALGHLYTVKGGFIPVRTYVFVVSNQLNVAVEAVKKVMDFFFSVLLDTEWYIKEIPPGSLLFPQEAMRLYGMEIMEEQYGTINAIRSSRSK